MAIRATYRHLIANDRCAVASVEVEVDGIDALGIRDCTECGQAMRCGGDWGPVADAPVQPRQTCCVCHTTTTEYVSRMIRWGARFHFCQVHAADAPRYEIKSQVDGFWVGDAETGSLVSGPYYHDHQALEAATLWNAGGTPSALDMMLKHRVAR